MRKVTSVTYTISEEELKKALGLRGDITYVTFQKHGSISSSMAYQYGQAGLSVSVPKYEGPSQLTVSITETEDV